MLRTVVLALTPSPSPKERGEPEKLSKSLSPGRGLKAFGIYEKGEGNSGFQVRRGLTAPFFCRGERLFAPTSNQFPDRTKSIILSQSKKSGCHIPRELRHPLFLIKSCEILRFELTV